MARIIGTDDNDILNGTAEADVIRSYNGNDELYGNEGNDKLYGAGDRDELYGGAGDDYMEAGGHPDLLVGGEGADTMDGGSGNDVYYADGADTIIEDEFGGTDRVYVGEDFTLAENVEELRFTITGDVNGTGSNSDNDILGTAGRNVLNGRGGHDELRGLEGNDRLIGGWGQDFLDGGTGADRMDGGAGDDHFKVDNIGDVVTDPDGGSIETSVSFDLRNTPNIDRAHLNSSDENDYLIGNAKDNYLSAGQGQRLEGGGGDDYLQGNGLMIGGSGNDYLEDLSGSDMYGGTGDDVYAMVVYEDNYDTSFTNVHEKSNEGFDTLRAAFWDYLPPSGTVELIDNIEHFILGNINEDAINVQGDERNDSIELAGRWNAHGGAGNDRIIAGMDYEGAGTINGGTGNDTIGSGRSASQTLIGGTGADQFLFMTQSKEDWIEEPTEDLIQDFEDGIDRIAFSTKDVVYEDGTVGYEGFTGLGAAGTLSASRFHAGTEATTAQHRIIYDADTGSLYYDRDGTGASEQMLLATIAGAPDTISNTDFIVV